MPEKKTSEIKIEETGEATGVIRLPGAEGRSITVIGTRKIREGFEQACLEQAVNTRLAPGVEDLVLNPDAHWGYGAPIGCVLVSPTHIYPGPVGVDIKCSMSLLETDLAADEISERPVRRKIIDAICERVPTGPGRGQRSVKKSQRIDTRLAGEAVINGATEEICDKLGIPFEWAQRCEDAFHSGHDKTAGALRKRLEQHREGGFPKFSEKLSQLGSYGGGNHFAECEVVEVADSEKARNTAEVFGLKHGHVAFLSHCGSRGFGYNLAFGQFKKLEKKFKEKKIPLPGGSRELVYARLGSRDAKEYLDDMALGGNFATVNHLLINKRILEAFHEVFPGLGARLVYCISHNIARCERFRGKPVWVHRKGATRAFPSGHPELAGTPFEKTGHPILLPGNPKAGSVVMVAEQGAKKSCYSINHGAGRVMGRRAAIRTLEQKKIDEEFDKADILTNCRKYPRDEAPAVYKDFNEVIRSVEKAGLASTVARLKAVFVVKDAEKKF